MSRLTDGSSAPVQRLVGFEIEAHYLPQTTASGDAVERVVNFLDGMPHEEGVPRGDAETWHRENDTNSGTAQALRAERTIWRQAATNDVRRITAGPFAYIPEYVTEPFDETQQARYTLTTGRIRTTQNLVFGVNDMVQAITEIGTEIAARRAAPANLGPVQLGVPVAADWVAAAHHFGIADADTFGGAAHGRMRAAVAQDENYVQTTVGVLPERLTTFLDQAANQTNFNADQQATFPVSARDPLYRGIMPYFITGKTMEQVDVAVAAAVAELTRKTAANAIAEDADEAELGLVGHAPEVPAGDGPLATTNDAEKAALEGVLRLILYVTTANMLGYTRFRIPGIEKNLVSFFPKTPLNAMINNLPYRVKPSRLRTFFFAADFRSVVARVEAAHDRVGAAIAGALGDAYPLSREEIAGTKADSVLGVPSVHDFLWNVLSGSSDSFHAGWAKDTIPPERPERGGREGIATNNWFWQQQRTRAVVMELRHVARKLPVNQLVTFARTIGELVGNVHQ